MSATTLPALIRGAAANGDRTAVLAFTATGRQALTRKELLDRVDRRAQQLRAEGLEAGARVLLFAPNGIPWIEIALAVMTAGGIVVPVDAQMGEGDLAHVVADAGPWRVYTTEDLRSRLPEAVPAERICWLEDARIGADTGADVEAGDPDAIAAIFYTSGTTGPPKGVPLTHANIVSNVRGLLEEGIAHTGDRVLLPLPLHHVYPFSIGLVTVLAVGATMVLPQSLVGPRIAEALRESEATILLGVPRLYDTLWSRLEARLGGGQALREHILHGVLDGCTALRRRFGINAGRTLFRPVMKRLAPGLRLAVSGGAALDPQTGARFEGLGWTVATGYGLTETSPILTLNAPGEARLDTAGRPLPGVELGIADGEVIARGPNVFAGYWNDAVPRSDILDAEGWFHTGDGGQIDTDGFLHLTGRLSATIVLPGGENIDPERIERALAARPDIREAGVLDVGGRLGAVIVAEPAREQESAEDTQHRVDEALVRAQQTLPAHHAIGQIQISADPLPRTRLGKLRRHRLKQLHADLQAGHETPTQTPIDAEDMAPEDQSLLGDPVAAATWQYLAERFANERLTPDSRLHRDLGLDSLSWVDLGIALRERAGIELGDEAIGRVESVRDLLQEAVQADQSIADEQAGASLIDALQQPESMLDAADQRRLAPRGPLRHAVARLALAGCRLLNRLFATVEVKGTWPVDGPCLITPRHVSAYDPIALTSALSRERIEPMFWAGWTGMLFSSPLRRAFSHVARILPIDPGAAPRRSLALAAACLERGHPLVWFPEGRRGADAGLQELRPGIGLLLAAHPVPVVPVWIEGTNDVLPIGRIIPRRGRVTIHIGEIINPDSYGTDRRGIVECVETAMRQLGEDERTTS